MKPRIVNNYIIKVIHYFVKMSVSDCVCGWDRVYF